jgi:hypothetical protein
MGRAERPRRLLGLFIGAGATLAVVSPLFEDADRDSFPISSYPMFARPRGQPTLFAAVGRDVTGNESRLPGSVLGSSEVLQTKVLIERSVQGGPRAMQTLCNSIAERVAASSDAGRVRSIELVRRRYDPIGYFVSGPSPIDQERLMSCTVPRASGARPGGAER